MVSETTARLAAPSPAEPVDQPLRGLSVAYVLFIFPVLSETMVVTELLTLQRLGARVKVLSWATPEGKEFYTITSTQHSVTASLMPFLSYMEGARPSRAEVVAANARLLLRRGPAAYERAYRLALTYRMIGNRRSFARLAVWADRLLREGVQHVHAHFATEATAVAHVLSELSGLPFSFTAHAHDIYRTPQWLGEKLRAARFTTTVCEANRRHLLATYPDVPAEKLRIVRPGIDPRQFVPQRHPAGRPFRIVAVGRLVSTKGFVDLAAACALLRAGGLDVTCVVVGEGHDRPEVEEAIARHDVGDVMTLRGALPREEILPILDGADLFVLPCYVDPATNDRDGMPLVLVEAMAKGLPVVSTPVSGIPELVRDGAGQIVPERDPAALADAIRRIAALSDDERARMGQIGRAIVAAEFNLLTETGKIASWFRGGDAARDEAGTTR